MFALYFVKSLRVLGYSRVTIICRELFFNFLYLLLVESEKKKKKKKE